MNYIVMSNNYHYERRFIMELLGHVLTVYLSARQFFNDETATNFIRQNAAKFCLPDTIRSIIEPAKSNSKIMPHERRYTHFYKGGSITFPINSELKNGAFIADDICDLKTGKEDQDEVTDFCELIETNPHIFTNENKLWGVCILSHLLQDSATDKIMVVEKYEDNTNANANEKSILVYGQLKISKERFKYKDSSRVIDFEVFRRDVATLHSIINSILVTRVGKQKAYELIEAAKESFKEHYPEKMAESAQRFITPNNECFLEADDLQIYKNNLIESGGFLSQEHANKEILRTINATLEFVNPIINYLRR